MSNPAPDPRQAPEAAQVGGRRRYGRQRGAPPVGEWFVARLGPAGAEPFAAIDDPPPAEQPSRPLPGQPIDALRFVAVDCETTGQNPHRLVELGAVAFTTAGQVASMETLVHCTDRINPYARRVHGISPALLAGAPPPAAVLARFRAFAAGTVLVEHSADAFDSRLLSRTQGSPLDNDSLDTSRLASALWDLRDTIGLERLCTELGVAHRGPHTALGDAEATAACFLALLDRGRHLLNWRTLGDLLAYGEPPPPRVGAPAPRGSRAQPVRRPAPPRADEPGTADPARSRSRRRGGRRRRRNGDDGDDGRPTGVGEDAGSPASPVQG